MAGFLTSIAIIPQVIKAWRSKSVRDISIWQPILLEIGMVLWLIYGIIISDLPLVAANSFSIICNTLLIFMKLRFQSAERKLPAASIEKNI